MELKKFINIQRRHPADGVRLPQVLGFDTSLGDLGVCHGDELFIMYRHKGISKTPRDLRMTDKMIKLWCDIAEGQPMPKGWRSVQEDATKIDYAILDLGDVRMGRKEEDSEERRLREFVMEKLVLLREVREKKRQSRHENEDKDEL